MKNFFNETKKSKKKNIKNKKLRKNTLKNKKIKPLISGGSRRSEVLLSQTNGKTPSTHKANPPERMGTLTGMRVPSASDSKRRAGSQFTKKVSPNSRPAVAAVNPAVAAPAVAAGPATSVAAVNTAGPSTGLSEATAVGPAGTESAFPAVASTSVGPVPDPLAAAAGVHMGSPGMAEVVLAPAAAAESATPAPPAVGSMLNGWGVINQSNNPESAASAVTTANNPNPFLTLSNTTPTGYINVEGHGSDTIHDIFKYKGIDKDEHLELIHFVNDLLGMVDNNQDENDLSTRLDTLSEKLDQLSEKITSY